MLKWFKLILLLNPWLTEIEKTAQECKEPKSNAVGKLYNENFDRAAKEKGKHEGWIKADGESTLEN